MLFRHVTHRSWMHTLNPMAKFLAIVLAVFTLTLVKDPAPTVFVAGLAAVLILFGARIPPFQVVRSIWPFMGFAVGLAWMNIAFPREGGVPLWVWGPFRVTDVSLRTGVTLGTRVVAIVLFSYLFAATTDPRDLALSMVHQARLPYRLAFGLFAGFRFLPLLHSELITVQEAHRMRGIGTEGDWRARVKAMRRLLVPLFAVVIRRAMQMGIAMESRAFGAYEHRTYLHETRFAGRDVLFLLGMVAILAGAFYTFWQWGWLTQFGPQLGTPYQEVP